MAKKPLMLMILDGWGIAPAGPFNAATAARTPHLDSYFANYPNTKLEASGEDVGLPAGQIGNSEVGHLNIGSGRIIYQDLSLISHAIKEGSFFKNQVLLDALRHAKEKDSSLHLMGLFSDGGVHSHIDHLKALLEMAKTAGLQKVYVHAFLDGRDVPPQSAIRSAAATMPWTGTNAGNVWKKPIVTWCCGTAQFLLLLQKAFRLLMKRVLTMSSLCRSV